MEENEYEELINVIVGLYKEKNELLDKLPYHLNVISSAARGKLKEIAHTMILTDLLKCPEIQKSFIKYFFDIEINNGLTIHRERREELGQPDIILYNNEICIIIENKVNSGPEQDSQCGRYYLIARDKLKSVDEKNKDEHIYFLYLNPNNRNQPSKNSLKIPDSEDKLVTDILGERFIVRSFAYDIREWLEQLYNELKDSKNEEYLKSGIYQYMDYLDCKYETGKRFDGMNNKLAEYLADGTKKIGKYDTIDKLTRLKEQAETVVETVSNIINAKMFERNKKIIEEIKEIEGKCKFEKYEQGMTEYGIKITKNECDFCIETNFGDDKIFYGIKCEGIDEPIKSKIKELLSSEVYKTNSIWPIYKYAVSSSVDGIYNEFVAFIGNFIDNEQQTLPDKTTAL